MKNSLFNLKNIFRASLPPASDYSPFWLVNIGCAIWQSLKVQGILAFDVWDIHC